MAVRPRFEVSRDTEALMNRLRSMQEGETVTYQELNRLVRGDVQDEKRHNLDSARRILQREEGRVYDPVPNVGIIKLTPNQIAQSAPHCVAKVHRTARRGGKRLGCVRADEFEKLSRKEADLHHMGSYVCAVIEQSSSHKARQKVEEVAGSGKLPKIPFSSLLGM